MTLVNGTDNIIVDYQHCRLGGIELTVGGLSGWKKRVVSSMSKNCLATTCSIILDKKVRLQMGRNELRSSVFIDGFLRRAVTRACFYEQGRGPVCRDALQMVATSSSTVRFTSQVGAGSRSQCLHGPRVISRCTSSAVDQLECRQSYR